MKMKIAFVSNNPSKPTMYFINTLTRSALIDLESTLLQKQTLKQSECIKCNTVAKHLALINSNIYDYTADTL